MTNEKLPPRFVEMPVTYYVVLDGITILKTEDFLLGVDCCNSWRKNHPGCDPSRIRLTEEWQYKDCH